ncbi:hypothetical protein Poli38472_002783 [Pythium oligandrum]|uniref:EF-hand domain-containing protein n=1 Tax=Pythium oligandrum TaxID=41045 RepID=A0A8K1FLH4_PYTOL|nr:hypothetical protein Poli38472_002783 [Pythium oligandrum]|eukprot:TMW63842.1 hypothetical protein Poli38472_002783 [Pythium oligandrum]
METRPGTALRSQETKEDDDSYAFVPESLRHHFQRDLSRLGDPQDEETHAIDTARRTRSALLVSTLLYTTPAKARTSPSKRNAKASPKKIDKPGAKSSRQRTPPKAYGGSMSAPLYSMEIEQDITKRMTLDRAVNELEQFIGTLTAKIASLEAAESNAVVPRWLSDTRERAKVPTLLQLQRKIVQSVASCLPDCDVYLAMYEPLPLANPHAAVSTSLLRYVASSSQSQMLGEVLYRNPERPSLSFEVRESLDPALVMDIAEHEQQTLLRFTTDTVTGPFACLPLVDDTNAFGIGVLSVDACRKAQQTRPEAMSSTMLHEFLLRMHLPDAALEMRKLRFGGRQFLAITENDLMHRPAYSKLKFPTKKRVLQLVAALKSGLTIHLATPPVFFTSDNELLAFLDDVCERSGRFLDMYRRQVHWHRVLAARTKDVNTTSLDLFSVLLHSIANALISVDRISIWRVRDGTDIDVLGSTQIPDDRLMPFLQWSERHIRRVSLYKENEDAGGRLMQGSIIRIQSPSNQDDPENQQKPCERAVYHVKWSNRTQQSLSWPSLRQLLPIRPMNAKHYQLALLLRRLQKLTPNELKSKFLTLTDPNNAMVALLRDPMHADNDVVYAVQVDFRPQSPLPDPATAQRFLTRAVAITQHSLVCVRSRETRTFQRQLSMVRTTRQLNTMTLTPSMDALETLEAVVALVFQEISLNLPNTMQQIAELQLDGSELLYTFAANGSTLKGRTMSRGQGVSFRCIDTSKPLVVDATSDLRRRLRIFRPKDGETSATRRVEDELPYIFIPLLHDDVRVGVLSISWFTNVPKGREDEAHPEHGVVDYLTSLSKPLAAAIYLKRRSFALYQLQQLRKEPLRSPQQLFFHACRALKDVMIGVWKTRIVEIDFSRGKSTTIFELSDTERKRAESTHMMHVIPLGFRIPELLPDTIARHWGFSESQVRELIKSWHDYDDEEERQRLEYEAAFTGERVAQSGPMTNPEKRRIMEKKVRRRYERLELTEIEDTATKETTNAVALAAARVSNPKYVSHSLSIALSTKTIAYAPVTPLAIGSSSAIFLAVASLPQLFSSHEQAFVDRVTETLSLATEELLQRVERSRTRVRAITAFRLECQTAVEEIKARAGPPSEDTRSSVFPLSPSEELRVESLLDLQQRTIRLISSVLWCPYVYIGLNEPFLRRIRYTAATEKSLMRGKHLHRGHGLSFYVLDSQEAVVATGQALQDVEQMVGHGAKLRVFSQDTPKWPFIAVPIGRHGVLALDNLEKYQNLAGEAQPELGLVDFLRQVATHLATAITEVRRFTTQLRRDRREQALVRVMAACEMNSAVSTPLFLQLVVLQAIESAFNGVDAYIGMVQPLCAQLVFTSATTKSGMATQRVNTLDSVSFRVFLSQRALVVPQLERHFDASEQESARLVESLKWFTASSNGSHRKGPFVCVPIPFVGVLSVDTFPGAAGGNYATQFPEPGVLECLTAMANLLGDHTRRQEAADAQSKISKLFAGNRTTFTSLFDEILEAIARIVLSAVEFSVLRYDQETNEPLKPLATLCSPVARLEPSISSMESEIRTALSGQTESKERCFTLPSALEVVLMRCSPTRDVEDDEATPRTTVLVVRRVKGATWMYDLEFLQTLVPLIDDLITRVNTRVYGIVRRRVTFMELERQCFDLEAPTLSGQSALDRLPLLLTETMTTIASAISPYEAADVYLGERQIGGETLRFDAVSPLSLMKGVALEVLAPENQSMVVLQCLDKQTNAVVHLMDGKNEKELRQLTEKKPQRVYVAIHMGESRILCADSLGVEAFDVVHRRLEADVLRFLKDCATLLESTILSVRYRAAYEAMCALKTQRHGNLSRFFSTTHRVLRSEIGVLQSQQVMKLANDFTGQFEVVSWHRRPTQRPLKTMGQHFCSINGCERHHILTDVHMERHVALPMTDLPRTLDQSRSSGLPLVGKEKQGTYACECFATMLDSSLPSSRLALCVFSHERGALPSRGKPSLPRLPSQFSHPQRQFFMAFAAVASDVYAHVFRACVLETCSLELFFFLRERWNIKDGLVVTVGEHDEANAAAKVAFSLQPAKCPRGSSLTDKLAAKVLTFYASHDPMIMFVSKKKATPPSPNAKSAPAPAPSKTMTITEEANSTKTKTSRSVFKRPKLFSSRQAPSKTPASPSVPVKGMQQQVPTPPESLTEVHVLVRGYKSDVLSFRVALGLNEHIKRLEADVLQQIDTSQSIRSTFLASPQGDEEWNGAGYGDNRDLGDNGGGGGFLVLSAWKKSQERVRASIVHFEADVRNYLTGVQATSREQILSEKPAPSSRPVNSDSLFASADSEIIAAAVVVVRAALLLAGSKKELTSESTAEANQECMKEYLRVNTGRKLVDLDPRDQTKWASVVRAGVYLRTHHRAVHALFILESESSSATQSCSKLLEYQHALVSAVRYFKYLVDDAKLRRTAAYAPAITIQCFYRVVRSRITLKRLRVEYHAAVSIQCAFRQHLARRKLLFLKWTRAIVTVQRAYRRTLAQRRGHRPKRVNDELRAVVARYGDMQTTTTQLQRLPDDDDTWKVDMSAFDSFMAFEKSKAGREQFKREVAHLTERQKEIARQREEQLEPHDRLLAHVHDLFELLDTAGSGELSRATTLELMTRLHVPLSKDEADDVIDMMDNDRSGSISFGEFTNWFAHEYQILRRRNRDCGVLLTRDRQWLIEESARSALRKQWRAMKLGQASAGLAAPGVAEHGKGSNVVEKDDEES